MRNVLLLLLMALMWGCQERMISPEDVVQVNNDVVYGSTAIRLPGLKGLGKASKKAQCTFELTISGDKMNDMVFTFQLGDKDTMVVIDKIPAGAARQFKGILYEGKTITYEGSAEARIQAGKVAFVKLYLRPASGSAEVEVIIEDDTPGAPLEGCMKLKGEIDGEPLEELSIEILGVTGDEFWTYIKRNGEFAGKFWGTLQDQAFEGEFGLQTAPMPYLVKGQFSDDWSMFKAEVFDINDQKKLLGHIEGFTIDCEDVPEPPPPPQTCFTDTLMINGCLSETQLTAVVLEQCIDNKSIPGKFNVLNSCSGNGFEGIAFDYCVPTGPLYCYNDSIIAPDGCMPEDVLMTMYLEFCMDNRAVPGSFSLLDPCTGKDGKGYSRILFDYCSEYQIDPPAPPPSSPECLAVDGVILEDTLFGEVYMRKVGFTENGFGFDLFRGGNAIGQFTGFFNNEYLEFIGFWKTDMQNAMVKGVFTPEGSNFKGTVFDIDDTTKVIGYIGGYAVDCSEIDPPEPIPPIDGCYTVVGTFGEASLEGLMMKDAGIYNGELQSYLYREDKEAAKFYGEITGNKFEGGIYLFENDAQAIVRGGFSDDFSSFEGVIIDQNNPDEIIGNIQLLKTDCAGKPNPILGCFNLAGELNMLPLDGTVSYTKECENDEFHASIARDGVYAGYMFGYAGDGVLSGHMVFETDTAMVQGEIDDVGFDAILFSIYDTTEVIGKMHGEKTECPKELFK